MFVKIKHIEIGRITHPFIVSPEHLTNRDTRFWREAKPRKKWNIAINDQIGNYKLALDNNLAQIVMPDDCLECTSMLCDNSKHALDIQQLHDDIISACIDASEDIPSTRKNIKIVPGWNEFVNPEKEKAILWRKIWISNGSPRHGQNQNQNQNNFISETYNVNNIKINLLLMGANSWKPI